MIFENFRLGSLIDWAWSYSLRIKSYTCKLEWNKNVKMVQPILDGRLKKDYPEKLKIQREKQLKSFKEELPKELKTSIAQGYLIKFKELRDFAN